MTDNTQTEALLPSRETLMAQAQVFASAWAIAGSSFDSGDGMEVAEQEKAILADMTRHLYARIAELEAQLESIGACGVSGPLVGRADSKEREALCKIGEEQAFEAWFKVDCPVEGASAKIAAKAAWKARASLAVSAVSGPLMGQPQAMPDLTALTERGAKAWAGVDAQGLRDGAASAGSEPVAVDGWLHENGLLYRLTDERHPRNRDEINVTMADGLRSIESRSRRALELLDRIRAARPSPPEGMVGGWMPIETAPKEGVFLAYMQDEVRPARRMEVAKWHPNVKTVGGLFSFDCATVTHWMPLPPPPTASAGSGKGE